MRHLLMATLVFIAAFVTQSQAAEIEFEIENLSNGSVFVAEAHNRSEPVSKGWVEIRSNEKRSFKADWESQYCLRVEQKGREITFHNFENFLNFPATQERFTVIRTDNQAVDIFKWGSKLEHTRNIKRGDQLPDGWGIVRFLAGREPRKYHLEVLP